MFRTSLLKPSGGRLLELSGPPLALVLLLIPLSLSPELLPLLLLRECPRGCSSFAECPLMRLNNCPLWEDDVARCPAESVRRALEWAAKCESELVRWLWRSGLRPFLFPWATIISICGRFRWSFELEGLWAGEISRLSGESNNGRGRPLVGGASSGCWNSLISPSSLSPVYSLKSRKLNL